MVPSHSTGKVITIPTSPGVVVQISEPALPFSCLDTDETLDTATQGAGICLYTSTTISLIRNHFKPD